MQIKQFLSLVISLYFLNLALSVQGMLWQNGNSESILNKAKSERKLVYVDISTTWCGLCKPMDAEVYELTS